MNEKKIRYLANRRKKVEEKDLDMVSLKVGSEEIEEHHLEGKKNSEIKEPLCKPCHDYITSKQNSLSVEERKNTHLLAYKSVLGLFELASEHLRAIIEREIQDGKNSD